MTNNERKIFEILGVKTDNRKNSKEILNECSFVDRCSYQTALEMAEWKDKQFAKHGYTKEQLREMGFAFTLNGDIVTPKEEKEMQVQYFKYKEQQMIDKASKLFEDNFKDSFEEEMMSNIITEFKKAMKGE